MGMVSEEELRECVRYANQEGLKGKMIELEMVIYDNDAGGRTGFVYRIVHLPCGSDGVGADEAVS